MTALDPKKILQNAAATDSVRRDRARIDDGIAGGKLPAIKKRNVVRGYLFEMSPDIIRSGVFKYSHARAVYDLENPLILENSWGISYYVGPALFPSDLFVLAAMLQLCGTQILEGPRKSFQMLHVSERRDSDRVPKLEDPDYTQIADPYENLRAIFGHGTITAITSKIYGAINGQKVANVTASILRLWQGHFFTHVNPRKTHRHLPAWLRMKDKNAAPPSWEDSSVDDGGRYNPDSLNARMKEVLGYDPLRGAESPIRRHPIFDLVTENGLDPRGGFKVIFSHYISEMMLDEKRLSLLDVRVRRELRQNDMAIQFYALLCATTSEKNPNFRMGYDKLYRFMDCQLTYKSNNNENKKELQTPVPNYGEFRREVNKRLVMLEDIGVLAWSEKPPVEGSENKTKILLVTRKSGSLASDQD